MTVEEIARRIEKLVADRIARKQWRSETEKEVTRILPKEAKAGALAYVRAAYDAAGAGFSGRFSS